MFNVVIVDDEIRIAESIGRYCKECQLIDLIKIESNPQKVIENLQNSTYCDYNLYLLDIEMSIRGDDLAKEIKGKYPDVQIVFVSGYEKRASISYNNNEISGVLDKPVVKQELFDLITGLSSKSLVLKMFNIYNGQNNPIEKPISSSDIIAITSDRSVISPDFPKNNIALLLNDGCYRLNSTVDGFIKKYQISSKEFVKISGSTYLNLNSVKEFSISSESIITKNDLKFKVSRGFKDVFEDIRNRFSQK
ncbi:MAG: hypothetical protein COC06_10135 [Bacteroidales bacterium]|nr:MAG: hypothetical protein COC06_10135 [Bacteroidales bacterium]